MKKLLFISALICLASCSVLKDYSTEGFTTKGNTVYYNDKAMAKLSGIEFALDNKKFVREMTFKLLEGDNNDKIHNLLAYLHKIHPDYEIEIEIPIELMEEFDKAN